MTAPTAERRLALLQLLSRWVADSTGGASLEDLARHRPQLAAEILEEYGKTVFVARWARGSYAETINAVVVKFPWLKGMLAGCWQVLHTWSSLEPTKVHPPAPWPLVQALVGTALTWKWPRLALLILLGFVGLLRPCEMLAMAWTHFTWPSQHGLGRAVFLHVQEPKTRFRGPRNQHVKIDAGCALRLLEHLRPKQGSSELLWPGSSRLFLKRFRLLVAKVAGSERLIFPSSLRPGGATYLFQMTGESVSAVLWRGRWSQIRTLGHYIQELQCINVMGQMPEELQEKAQEWADMFDEFLEAWCTSSGNA